MRKILMAFALAIFTIAAAPQDRGTLWLSVPCSGVRLSGNCITDPTPEQRRQYEAEQEQAAMAAERDRLAAEDRAAEHQAQVDQVARQLNLPPHRRAEAENLLAMQQRAAAARQGVGGRCRTPGGIRIERVYSSSIEGARANIDLTRMCAAGVATLQGAPDCRVGWFRDSASCRVTVMCPAGPVACGA